MLAFPKLSSGAIAQYPLTQTHSIRNEVLKFLDGAEQRYRLRTNALKRWSIELDLLTEAELNLLINFFQETQGAFESFSFVDPWSSELFPSCSFEVDAFEATLYEITKGKSSLTIRQNLQKDS